MKYHHAILLSALFLILGLFSIASAQTRDLDAVAHLDLNRYAGKWYEIAKYPNRFQKQCVANTTAIYTIKSNGRIEVNNQCVLKDGRSEQAVGEAKVDDKKTIQS